MALITTTRIGRFASIATVLAALVVQIPTTESADNRTSVVTVTAKQVEATDPSGIYGADPEFAATIESAIDRFSSAGLDLPELRIYYHSDPSGCPGATAQFNQDGSGTRIDLCTQVTYTLLHELAHAWEHHSMDDSTRQAYLEHAGLNAWADPNVDWVDRGVESAATSIAWGLLETPITNPAAFPDELRSFELLTGTASPRLQSNCGRGCPVPGR